MARDQLERAITTWNEVLPSGHPDLLYGQNSLAVVLMQERRLTEAEGLARRTATAAISGLGYGHPLTATALRNLGAILAKMGHTSEALQKLEQAIELHERTFGSRSPILAEVLREYSDVLRKAGRKQDAKRAASRADTMVAPGKAGSYQTNSKTSRQAQPF